MTFFGCLRAVLVAVLLPMLFAGCGADPVSPDPGHRVVIFLDLTASVDHEQRAIWLRDASALVQTLKGGWGVSVFAIHDHTMDAAPLFAAEIPQWQEDAPLDVAGPQKAALVRARRGANEAIQKALNDTGRGA